MAADVSNKKTRIAPSILSAHFGHLAREIEQVEAAGADYIHVDVMDGHFVPNITIGPVVVASLIKVTTLPLDIHLMIQPTTPYLTAFPVRTQDILTIHAEASHHLDRDLNLIREQGCRTGLALNPATPVTVLEHVLPLVDLVLVMTVNPGFGGQSFIPAMLGKIKQIRRLIDNSGRSIELEVDGGITPGNIARVAAAGAEVFVAGSAIFSQPDYGVAIQSLRTNA
jgi:ribulose-phosphate 3-epimerase